MSAARNSPVPVDPTETFAAANAWPYPKDPSDADWAAEMATVRKKIHEHGENSASAFLDRDAAREAEAQIAALLAPIMARAEAHRLACASAVCRRCGHHGCASCRVVRVAAEDATCSACGMREATDAMQIPRRYADALDHLSARVRNPAARQLAAQSLGARALVARGYAGVGKTTFAAGVALLTARTAIEAGRRPPRILFVTAIDLGLARSQHRLGAGEADLVSAATDADILIVDDLGAEAVRDVDAISTVIHARYNSALPTWVTTALSDAEVASRYGGGIERRIFEGAVVIDCNGGRTQCDRP
jgi:hypothetical protein